MVEIGPVILEEKNFKCRIHYPLEKGISLHFKKHESPSPKNALCQVLLIFFKFYDYDYFMIIL